ILTHWASDVVVQTVLLSFRNVTSDIALELGFRPFIRSPAVGSAIWAPTWDYFWHITDGVPYRDFLGGFFRPLEFQVTLKRHENKALTELRDTVAPCIYNAEGHAVSNLFKLFDHVTKNEHLVV